MATVATAVIFIAMYLFAAIPRIFYPYDLDFIENGILMGAWIPNYRFLVRISAGRLAVCGAVGGGVGSEQLWFKSDAHSFLLPG